MNLCPCTQCLKDRGEPLYTHMVLCKTCGNKRCPHATDHRLVCTNSNDSGQQGSSYGIPLKSQTELKNGPGTPTGRFTWIMDELQKRFPDPEPYSAFLPEARFFKMMDEKLAEIRGNDFPILTKLRECGLSVAVHNDYSINGINYTFWLFTQRDDMSFKGEGVTDEEALEEVYKKYLTFSAKKIF